MADWISEVDRKEAELIAAGVPAREAIRVAALFANALAQADRAKRNAEARRCELSATVKMCRELGTTAAARELGISPQGARKRRADWFRKFATGNR